MFVVRIRGDGDLRKRSSSKEGNDDVLKDPHWPREGATNLLLAKSQITMQENGVVTKARRWRNVQA